MANANGQAWRQNVVAKIMAPKWFGDNMAKKIWRKWRENDIRRALESSTQPP
jgi:hypothetical protein